MGPAEVSVGRRQISRSGGKEGKGFRGEGEGRRSPGNGKTLLVGWRIKEEAERGGEGRRQRRRDGIGRQGHKRRLRKKNRRYQR